MDSYNGWMYDLKRMERRLDALYPDQCREKSLAKTKLDEARLWVHELSKTQQSKKEDTFHERPERFRRG